MVYDHMVKKNGVYYQAWESMPDDSDSEEAKDLPLYSDSEIVLETQDNEEKRYTKTEIKRMSTEELQNLAASIGVDGAFDMSGTDLKNRLISDMGL